MSVTNKSGRKVKVVQGIVAVLGIVHLMPSLGGMSSPLPSISVSRTKLSPDLEAALFSAKPETDIQALQALAQKYGYTIEVV